MIFTSQEDAERYLSLEAHFAYEHASSLIDGMTGPAPLDDYSGPIWHNLEDADCDLSAEVFYLDTRRLVTKHPSNPEWIQIREEHNPLPAADQAVTA